VRLPCRVGTSLPGFDPTGYLVASADGGQLYQFDTAGRHLRTLDALTKVALYTFTYDAEGRLVSVTDVDGDVTRIERDAEGQPTEFVSPDGQRTALTLDAGGYIASVANPAGDTHRMTYSSEGLITAFTDPNGNSNTFEYDGGGRLIRDIDAIGGGWTIGEASQPDGYINTMTTGEGHTTQFGVAYLTTGDRRQLNTYPDGTVLDRLFETTGKETVTAPDGTLTASQDGPDPRFGMLAPLPTSTTVTTPAGLTATVARSRGVTLDVLGDPMSLATLTDTTTVNGRASTTTFTSAGRTITATSAGGRTATTQLNDKGRPLTRTLTGLEPLQFAYGARGRRQDVSQGQGANARTVHYDYYADGPAKGWLHTVTDPLGRSLVYDYDAAGRVTQTTSLPDGRAIQFGYDRNGNLKSLTPPGQPAHVFDYTAADQTSAYTPPIVDTAEPATHYAFNRDRQLTQITRPGGEIVSFLYDAAGRLQTISAPQGDSQVQYDAKGRVQSRTTPDGIALSFAYDGSLLTQSTWAGSVAGSVGYGYDTDFRIKSVTVNGINAISYGYDADSLLTSAGTMTLTRNPQNGLLTGTRLASGANAVTVTPSYNGFGEVTGSVGKFNATELFNLQLGYDLGGRINHKSETIGGLTTTFDYGYDTAGRLEEVKQNGVVVATYGYDPNGSRTTMNGQTVATYDVQDRLTTYLGAAYSYTADGELLSKAQASQSTTYSYDVFGNLRHVDLPGGSTIDYLVDARNRRIGKKVNGILLQSLLYQNQLKPIAELDGNNQVVSRFVYADKANVPAYLIKAGTTYRIISDHLGSPRLIVNVANGTIAQRMDYDEWGRVIQDTNPGFQPFGYAGGLYDRDTGLVALFEIVWKIRYC
jgi:YD repeat-containing protein